MTSARRTRSSTRPRSGPPTGVPGYDADGALAAAGTVNDALLKQLLDEPYYRLAAPKTTGKELFNADYLERALAGYQELSHVDLVATVTALTAQTVADDVRRHGVDTLVASGGGCDNPTLMAMLAERLPGVRLTTTAEFGAPTDTKEAIAFALIGWHTAHGLPGTVPSATGATASPDPRHDPAGGGAAAAARAGAGRADGAATER